MTVQFPNDPLFRYQWFLYNTGQAGGGVGNDIRLFPSSSENFVPVWDEYTGKGVRVAVVDVGVQLNHPDLAANIDVDASWDAVDDVKGGDPRTSGDNHGTSVAGLIGAVANNGIGGSGVAPNATLLAYRVQLGGQVPHGKNSLSDETVAFRKALEYNADIVSNSWGTTTAFANQTDQFKEFFEALGDLVTKGREGKGSVVVFSNTNSNYNAIGGVDSNLNNILNSQYVIAVGALNNNDTAASYSTRGANLLVSAPGGADTDQNNYQPGTGVLTTDRTGADGYNEASGEFGDYNYNFNGTSAAAPIVSGVVALMLQANPDLGYRDVQEILAHSARFVDPAALSWTATASGTWNGGGALFSREYGFGAVNAHAAVRLAEVYRFLDDSEEYVSIGSRSETVFDALFRDHFVKALEIDLDDVDVNHIDLHLKAKIANPSHLTITLRSPEGTEINLLQHPYGADHHEGGWPANGFSLGTSAYWGEQSGGKWTVFITGIGEHDHIESVELTANGGTGSTTTEFVYTDDFSKLIELEETLANRPSRTVISGGTDDDGIINAAAVTTDTVIDLNTGWASIAGQFVTIKDDAQVTTAFTGDGNDRLFGNDADNTFFAGRGINVIWGGEGTDTLLYGASRAQYNVSLVKDGGFTVTGKLSTDTAVSVEYVTFDEGTLRVEVATDDALAVGALYRGLLFRDLDKGGFHYWADQTAGASGLTGVANAFLASDEYLNGAATHDNATFVSELYRKLLLREADDGGAAFWQQQIDTGAQNRAEVVLAIGNTTEYRETHLSGVVSQIVAFDDIWA